jgi:RES domain-containing protein
VLEILAGSGRYLPDDYVSVAVEIPDDVAITTFSQNDLPADWWRNPHQIETLQMGSAWVSKRETAILSVPSAVVRQERNYILNPAHPDFTRFSFGEPEIFFWDDRLRSLS